MLMSDSANGAFVDHSEISHHQGASVRIPFVHGCRLTIGARARGGLVCNLSIQGVYVTLDEPLPEQGESVHIAVHLPGQLPMLEADTVVTWQNRKPSPGPDSLPPGVGLRFSTLAPVYRERIASLVQQHEKSGSNDLVLPNLPHAGPKRVPYVQRCMLTTASGETETLVCNLSRLGAYVTARPAPKLGEEIRLSFSLPDDLAVDLKGV